tara:strand:+ start:212 stop:430 length:219 start_codon:yes stop_codon:yes gene_type:complete
MVYEKGDKVSGKYLGQYDFQGIIWHTEVNTKGQNIYIDLERPIFIGQSVSPRTGIFIDTRETDHALKKTLDI